MFNLVTVRYNDQSNFLEETLQGTQEYEQSAREWVDECRIGAYTSNLETGFIYQNAKFREESAKVIRV